MVHRTPGVGVLGLALSLTLGGLATLPAMAAPTWVPPVTPLSDGVANAETPVVVVSPAGEAVAVWHNTTNNTIRAATRPWGGTWSAPETLSGSDDSLLPDVVVDRAGNATAVWTSVDPPFDAFVVSATRAPGGAWTAPVPLTAGDVDAFPRVGVEGDGTTTATWVHSGATDGIQVSTRPAGGIWAIPVPLTTTVSDSLRLAVNADGVAAAVWLSSVGGNKVVHARVRQGGTWASQLPLSASELVASKPQVAVDPQGQVTVVWHAYDGFTSQIQAVTRSTTGVWGSVVPLSSSFLATADPALVVDGQGTATALWTRTTTGIPPGGPVVLASSRPSGGSWSPAVPLSDSALASRGPQATADAFGTVTAVWTSDGVVHAARRPAGGSWTPMAPLSAPSPGSASPLVAVAPDGDGVAAWLQPATSIAVLQARGLDVAGPRLDSFSASATGTTGQGLSFAATASDNWSPPVSLSWSFGDGSTAAGASVVHAYTAVGTFPVTLTATDAVGNTTTRSSTIAVTPGATPSVPPPAPLAAPAITTFQLTKRKIATDEQTKLKVKLSVAATLKVVVVSRHRHLVKGTKKYLKLVIRGTLPAGVTKVTIKGKKLAPDTWKVVGTAKNAAGTSGKKKTRLVVVEP